MVITETGNEIWTKEDYFTYHGHTNTAGEVAQDYINEIWGSFNRFIKTIGMEMTANSEWYYSIPHDGIHLVTKNNWYAHDVPEVKDLYDYESSTWCANEYEPDVWCDYEWLDVYDKHYPRIKTVSKWLRRTYRHLLDSPTRYYGFFQWSYARRSDEVMSDRRERVLKVYKGLVKNFCDDLARTCAKTLESACDYAYSDEAAQEWADSRNEDLA